ncbi:MAG: type 2 lanthipeptide synthetase LanM family protein [Pseudolabrys sp.]
MAAMAIDHPDSVSAPTLALADSGGRELLLASGATGNRMSGPGSRLRNPIGETKGNMEAFYERLTVRAATIDELLSDDFEPLLGQKGDAELAERRLAAWCRSSAGGDWALFGRRLQRDGLTTDRVLSRLSSVRRKASASPPAWIDDAIWIEAALQSLVKNATSIAASNPTEPCAFEHLFAQVVEQAEAMLWSSIGTSAREHLAESARACLRHSLLKELTGLSAPAVYERFAKVRKVSAASPDAAKPRHTAGKLRYDQFIAQMKAGGFRGLFEDKPIILRLLATIVRQWIDTSREFILRLDADLATIRRELLHAAAASRVAKIAGDLSDPHNCGHSVQIVSFEDGSRVVYKPKDLRLDAAWYDLVGRLNRSEPPVNLQAVRALARDGYGWTEFVDHTGCGDRDGYKRFFRRAGAWLALFHCFATNDMHQENMIAAGDHPVPIDLETILQATAAEHTSLAPQDQAYDAAIDIIANSVMMVGLLPAYARGVDDNVFAVGGMTADWNAKIKLTWNNINSDDMRPAKSKEVGTTTPNLPHVEGRSAKFADHVDDFTTGFADYAKFLLHLSRGANQGGLFDGFSGVPIRKVIRPTRFYYMLLQRLKNHQPMDDGAIWSAQADFIARLSDWEKDSDPIWRLQRAERSALLALNVPHFVSSSDGNEIRDATGISVSTEAASGVERARARVRNFDEQEIAWQITVIGQNLSSVSRAAGPSPRGVELKIPAHSEAAGAPIRDLFVAEADKIAAELSRRAIRRGPSAAWIGLDWLGDSEVFQLVCLGADLYNGVPGITVFLAAHAAVTGHKSSSDLALAGLAHLRNELKSRNAARMARSLGIGGATGLGSIVYALAVTSKCLHNEDLLADAHLAAELMTDALIAADKQLDVMGGGAGAILGLLRLYRDTQSADVLERAVKCGEHLLRQPQVGSEGRRSWSGQGSGQKGLNGMSHGAAGFAYALASLATASGRDEFAQAASECVAFEDASYDATRNNWPDLRHDGEPARPCQWCHGAPGIGLARIASVKRGGLESKRMATDIRNALGGVERSSPVQVDTLCCGTLGSVEFFCEAATALGRGDLRELASRRLVTVLQAAASTGDYRWNSGDRRFNLGLFRGLSGVGYTSLRQVDNSLPNILIWE